MASAVVSTTQNPISRHLFSSGFYLDSLEVLRRIKKLEGEEKDEVSGCFRDKTPRVGCEASERERWKMILVSWFGNWVDGMLFIKIGETQEEEQVWVGKGASSVLGQAEFEVPKGNRGGDPQ